MSRYLVVIEDAGSNYGAYAPDVPGCIATGDTPEATLAAFQEALEFHFKGMREDGLPIPTPTSVAAYYDRETA